MKITATDNNTPEVRPYPKLMINKDTGRIVLMTKWGPVNSTGVTLKGTGKGVERFDWGSFSFVDYEGVLTMENDK